MYAYRKIRGPAIKMLIKSGSQFTAMMIAFKRKIIDTTFSIFHIEIVFTGLDITGNTYVEVVTGSSFTFVGVDANPMQDIYKSDHFYKNK